MRTSANVAASAASISRTSVRRACSSRRPPRPRRGSPMAPPRGSPSGAPAPRRATAPRSRRSSPAPRSTEPVDHPRQQVGQLAVTRDAVEAAAGKRGEATIASSPSSTSRTSKPASAVACQSDTLKARATASIRSSRSCSSACESVVGWQEPDRVTRVDLALDQDPGVHPRVERMGQDRDPTGSSVAERPGDRVARHVRLADLEHEPVADRRAGPDGQRRPLDPLGREILAGRPRTDRVAVGLDPADRLDGEQGHRAMRPAVDRVAAVRVAGESERTDPRLLDRLLRDATRRDVHLEHPPVHPGDPTRRPEPGGGHIRKTPKCVSGIGALRAAARPSARTRRVSSGSMTPSSHSRAVAKYGLPSAS